MIIKVKFLKGDQPTGREYSYYSNDTVSVGETISIDGKSKGIVTAVGVPEEEIEAFKERVKTIYGKE